MKRCYCLTDLLLGYTMYISTNQTLMPKATNTSEHKVRDYIKCHHVMITITEIRTVICYRFEINAAAFTRSNFWFNCRNKWLIEHPTIEWKVNQSVMLPHHLYHCAPKVAIFSSTLIYYSIWPIIIIYFVTLSLSSMLSQGVTFAPGFPRYWRECLVTRCPYLHQPATDWGKRHWICKPTGTSSAVVEFLPLYLHIYTTIIIQ